VRTPTTGTGKPEPLKHALRGYWSRRIDDEHRIVCRVEGEQLWIVQVRFHYE
jgi:toxin YoeB